MDAPLRLVIVLCLTLVAVTLMVCATVIVVAEDYYVDGSGVGTVIVGIVVVLAAIAGVVTLRRGGTG